VEAEVRFTSGLMAGVTMLDKVLHALFKGFGLAVVDGFFHGFEGLEEVGFHHGAYGDAIVGEVEPMKVLGAFFQLLVVKLGQFPILRFPS
jgi:hypothetical protein